jgi:hypothetical protein
MDECTMRVTECDGEILSIALANDAGEFVVEEDSADPVDHSGQWRAEAAKWKCKCQIMFGILVMETLVLLADAIWAGTR